MRLHAAADRNSVTLTIAPESAERTVQIALPRWSLRILGGLLLAGVLLNIVGGVLYGKLLKDSLVLRTVREENAALRDQLARVERIDEELRAMDEVRKSLFLMAGVQPGVDSGEPLAGRQSGGLPLGQDIDRSGLPFVVLPYRGPVSRGFAAPAGADLGHTGCDIAGRQGAPILAPADATVRSSVWDSTFGNMLVLDHSGGWTTTYGHTDTVLVQVGDRVRAGEAVALVGSTGQSSAPHVHLEVKRSGMSIDPAQVFPEYSAY